MIKLTMEKDALQQPVRPENGRMTWNLYASLHALTQLITMILRNNKFPKPLAFSHYLQNKLLSKELLGRDQFMLWWWGMKWDIISWYFWAGYPGNKDNDRRLELLHRKYLLFSVKNETRSTPPSSYAILCLFSCLEDTSFLSQIPHLSILHVQNKDREREREKWCK